MNHYEHAQQIFSMLLAAKLQTGIHLPVGDAIRQDAETAMLYAKGFADAHKKEVR